MGRTKGKWKAVKHFVSSWDVEQDGTHGIDTVAHCGSHRQAETNAALIAAAPDLLEACVKTIEYLNYPPKNMVDALHAGIEVRNVVQAAINAAE